MTNNETSTMIDLDTARALVARGWSVVPTNSDDEKRPLGRFATAKSWRDFSERLPTDAELLGWFGPKPRRGGVVLHAGQLCVDRDTKDAMPDGSAPWEETDHGSHEFFRCPPGTTPSHDHDAKIDYLTCGTFVRLANPRCLLDWKDELPMYQAAPAAVEKPSAATIRDMLVAQGWRPLGVHGNREDFSRPGAAHPQKCDASLFDGSSFKVWSTAATSPAPAHVSVPEEPEIVNAAELAAQNPALAEPILKFCRRGSFALVSGDPKAGKTTFALKLCAKKASDGKTCLYADFENGPALFWHRLQRIGGTPDLANIHYLDCRYSPSIDYIASAMRAIGNVDILIIDCWGLLIAGDGVEDESSNALVSAYFLRVRRTLAEFDAATVILHHTPKSGANEKLCFAGAGASSLQRYVQTIARISQDKAGAYWFNALCREFDDPFKPVMLRK